MSQSSGRDLADRTADVSTRPTVNRRSVSRARIPRKPVGGGGVLYSELVRLPRSEATTLQALMDLALPRFAGLGDGSRQICNKLGGGRPRLETGASDDGLSGFLKEQTQSGDGI